jgi:S1-C subfamily serine protease
MSMFSHVWLKIVCFTAATLLSVPALWADLSQEQVTVAKQATALVLLPNSSGSAFCISDSGLFITSNHVVSKAAAGSVTIVVNPAGKEEKKYPAKVVRNFPESDLAVLKIDVDAPIVKLKLGDDAKLFETQQLYAFGYPFGKMLATDDKSLPSISVNIGRVTSLRMKAEKLDAIQLDAQVNPGNSGGPVIDEQGNVVGVIFGGVLASGVNFATPVSVLKKAIEVPVLTVKAPAVTYEKRFDPAEFVISVDSVIPITSQPIVAVELTSDGQTRRVEAAKGPNGDYRASIVPMEKRTTGPQKIQVTLNYAASKIVGYVQDFKLQVGAATKALSDLRTIERASDKEPAKVDSVVAGLLPELAKLQVEVGGEVLTINGQNVPRIEITPPVRNLSHVAY